MNATRIDGTPMAIDAMASGGSISSTMGLVAIGTDRSCEPSIYSDAEEFGKEGEAEKERKFHECQELVYAIIWE